MEWSSEMKKWEDGILAKLTSRLAEPTQAGLAQSHPKVNFMLGAAAPLNLILHYYNPCYAQGERKMFFAIKHHFLSAQV